MELFECQAYVEAIIDLLNKCIKLSFRNADGLTILHLGVLTGNIEIVNALLGAEADVHATLRYKSKS